MTDIKIHDRLPSGFAYANAQQADWFTQHGHVKGARKVVLVKRRDAEPGDPETDLAVRLGPPKATLNGLARLSADREKIPLEDRLKWYEAQYNLGWAAGGRDHSEAWNSGMTNHAWDDGYLDRAAGRPKWHLAHCIDHDECGEG